ncbi:hypothetical protein BC332_14577 [Capsicum chinense]|nr:hypothetical protein BC332_14577 [Capsicum chinense]
MQICYRNLKASTSAEVGRFIKKLLEASPDILREYLIHLQEHMVTVITASASGARNIHVMIEFLLVIVTDMPKDIIHHDKLFDLLARVGALTREVSTLVRGLEEKSRNEESTDETSCATRGLLENIELLKEDLEQVYLKAPDSCHWCFPMSDGLLFMHLLHIHLKDLLDSNSYSIALIKEEIGQVKEDLEFIRSSFVNIEQELNTDLWHIKLIKEEVSNISEKIPKNRSLTVVNCIKKTVERKPLTAAKIFVGFKEETNWLISKLTSGLKDLEVISITGMPGLGKTTFAYKVYNDESVCSHFNVRAWCTVDQEYDEKKLLVKLFNQVTGLDLKFCEDIDVADELRRKLHGKRYLIVLDDVWDTTTWDELIRPFPKVEKGSLEKKKAVWLEVRNNLNSFILNSEQGVRKVIELSYDHLPYHLKPCLIYLACFPKDKAIEKDMLKMYWRAEGFDEQREMKSANEVMEVYFDNLISSSLVISFNEIGNHPTFQIHDLVHDFCFIKAREEKLFRWISSSDPSSSSDLMPRIVNIEYNKEHFELNNFILSSSKMKRHSELLRVDFKSSNTNDSGPSLVTNWSWNFHFPSNLKKLVLSDFPLASDSLSTIARLPNLEELGLIRTIIEGGEWNMGEGDTFENLKYLGLNEVTLESPQLEDSALEIKQYFEDITGDDKLQILSPNNIPLSKTGVAFKFINFGRQAHTTWSDISTSLSPSEP